MVRSNSSVNLVCVVALLLCLEVRAGAFKSRVTVPTFPFAGLLLFDPANHTEPGKTFVLRNRTRGQVTSLQNVTLPKTFQWDRLNFNPDGFGKAGSGPSLAGRISPDGRFVLLPNNEVVSDYNNVLVVDLAAATFVPVPGGWFPEYQWSADSRRFLWIGTEDGPSPSWIRMADAVAGTSEYIAGGIDTAAWSHDGKTLVYSKFPYGRWANQPDPLHHVLNTLGWRQFFEVPPGSASSISITPAHVDTLMGKAYRQALRVFAEDRGEPDFGRGGGLPPYQLLPAPDGRRVFVWSFGTPNTIRTRWFVVDGAGRKRYGAMPDKVLPYAWSQNSRYIYFLGADRIVAYDTCAESKQKIYRLRLNPAWGQLIAFQERQ